MTKQIKSKDRVAKHGEVFTAEREVNAMLDLVKEETERIDSRFLEPACGDGNFVVEILRRKLEAAKQQTILLNSNKSALLEFERQSMIAVASIYGIELLLDNVLTCRERMYDIWNTEYEKVCGEMARDKCREIVRFIISQNIICGNTLSTKLVDENGNDTDMPITFSEWSFVNGTKIKRTKYRLDKLIAGAYKG